MTLVDLAHQEDSRLVEVTTGEPITAIAARSPLDLFWRRFRQDRVAVASLVVIVIVILMAIFAPLVVKIAGVSGPNAEASMRPASTVVLATKPANTCPVSSEGRNWSSSSGTAKAEI